MIRRLIGHTANLTARSAMSVAKIFGVSDMVWSGISRLGIRGGGIMAASGVMVTAESAMLVAAYKRGVELLAGHVAKTSFLVKRGSEHDKKHPASKLLLRWARHHQVSAFEFRRTMMAQVLTRGNAYAYIVRRKMEPVELLILDAGQIQPYLVQGELLYKVNGREKMLAASDVIHIKGLGFNGFEGLDPIRYYAKEVLGLAIATQTYAATYYENGGTPSAYLKSEIPLNDDQFNRLKGEAGPLKRSLANPHELPVLEQTDIKSVGLSAEQTQLLSARKDIILDIANLLGLPPHKLGLAISSSYGSLEEENDAFREDALEPWLCQFESEFAKLLTEDEQETESHEIEAQRDDIKRLKLVDAAEYLSKLTGSQPLATVNEARAKIGLPRVEGGDDLSKPLNMGNQGGDPAAQPNAAPPEDDDAEEVSDVEDETEDMDETEERSLPSERPEMRAQKQAALADVYGRMARRLLNALKSVKSVDQLPEFRSKLSENHLPVIRSAFAPIVPLCGGDNPEELAAEFLQLFDGALENRSGSLESVADDFMIDAEILPEVILGEIERRCGAGVEGSKGFQPGNTCAKGGAMISGKTPREWFEDGTVPDGWYVHGRHGIRNGGKGLETGFVIQMTQDWDTAEQYAGKSGTMYMIRPKKDAKVADMNDEATREKLGESLKTDFDNGKLSPDLDEIVSNAIREDRFSDLVDSMNPQNIVDSAEMFDSHEFVSWLWDRHEIDFATTTDGAVVMNTQAIESHAVE